VPATRGKHYGQSYGEIVVGEKELTALKEKAEALRRRGDKKWSDDAVAALPGTYNQVGKPEQMVTKGKRKDVLRASWEGGGGPLIDFPADDRHRREHSSER